MNADYYQYLHPTAEHARVESATEIADDFAGIEVGGILSDLYSSKITESEANRQIFNRLCDH